MANICADLRQVQFGKRRVAPTFGRLCVATEIDATRPIVGAPQAQEAMTCSRSPARRKGATDS